MSPAWRQILHHIRYSLIALGVALVLALGVSFGSDYLENEWQQELQNARNQAVSLKSQIRQKQQDIDYLASHIVRFRILRDEGLLNEPKREALIEQLVAVQKNTGLPDTLSYALPPAQPMPDPNAPPAIPGVEAVPDPNAPRLHDIEFSMSQIHEGELLTLISGFLAETHHRFRVQSCQLSTPTPTGLTAQCTLRSFTLPVPATP